MTKKTLDIDTPASEFPVIWENASDDHEITNALDALVNKHVFIALKDIVETGTPLGWYEEDTNSASIHVVLDNDGNIVQVIDIEKTFIEEDEDMARTPAECLAIAASFQRLADHFRKLAGAA